MSHISSNLLQQVSNELAAAVATGQSGIVQVHARRRLPATGIIWEVGSDADNPTLIVTANHVVERDEDIVVSTADGTEHPARLLGRDRRSDIALLAVDAAVGEVLPRSEDAATGSLVLALGSVGGARATLSSITGTTTGRGHGRGHGRGTGGRGRGRGRGRRGMELIASTATMLPGFSGGPLLDTAGNVLGMLSSHLGHGETLAVPVATVERVATALRTHGKMRTGTIGVIAQSVALDGDLAELAGSRGGLLVNGLIQDGPAVAAGVAAGDLLVAIDEFDLSSMGNLLEALRDDRIGEEVTLRVVRGGAIVELTATVAERPAERPADTDE